MRFKRTQRKAAVAWYSRADGVRVTIRLRRL